MSSQVKPSKKRMGLIPVKQYSRGYWDHHAEGGRIGVLHFTQKQIDELGDSAKFVMIDKWKEEDRKRQLEALEKLFGTPTPPVERVPFTGYMDMIKKAEQ